MPRRSVPSTCWAMACADAIAILESELTALGRTVTASAPMLQTITRLGAGLNAFNANAAPIAMLSDARYLPDPPMEQLNPAMPKQTLIPSASRSDDHDRSRSTARFDPATPMHSQAQPRSDGSPPPARHVPRRAPVTTAHKARLRQNRRRIGHVSQRSRRPRHRRPNHHRAARCRASQPCCQSVAGCCHIDCSGRPRDGAIAKVGSRRDAARPSRPA